MHGNQILASSYSSIKDFFKRFLSPMASERMLEAYIDKGYFVDIGIPQDYFQFCERIK